MHTFSVNGQIINTVDLELHEPTYMQMFKNKYCECVFLMIVLIYPPFMLFGIIWYIICTTYTVLADGLYVIGQASGQQ